MNESQKINPAFKYIGGKSWLQKELCIAVEEQLRKNPNVNSYVEPFCGGLGAFLSIKNLLIKNNINNVQLNDINGNMINLYKYIKNDVTDILTKFYSLEKDFQKTIDLVSLIKVKEKEHIKKLLENANTFFMEQRELFNVNKNIFNKEQAIRFLFLQKHAFNGIYRENLKGLYNSPFNWSEKIINQDYMNNINSLSELFNNFNISFTNESFSNLKYTKNSLIYLDPPYINTDINENKYNKEHFSIKQQKELINKIKNNCFIYSNHKNDMIIEEFEKQNILVNIKTIERTNIISAKADGRKNKKEEILVTSL